MTVSSLLARACVVLLLWMPAVASAQTGDPDDANSSTALSTTSSSVTSSAVSSGGILMTVYLLTPKSKTAQLRLFMQNNRVALAAQAPVGAGDTLVDLSGAFGVDTPAQQRAFSALMRGQRAHLTRVLAHEHITHDQVMVFVRAIHAQMQSVAVLQPAADRMSAPRPLTQ